MASRIRILTLLICLKMYQMKFFGQKFFNSELYMNYSRETFKQQQQS